MSDGRKPRLTIVSVLYGGAETLLRTLPTWKNSITADVSVVFIDHSSRPMQEELGLEWAHYEWNPDNPGFAAGVNRGVQIARSERVFLLNPDVFLTAEAISAVLDQQGVGPFAVALRTNGVVHRGIEYSWWGFCRDRADLRRSLIGPSGGAALFNRALVLGEHPFPEHLFAWGEDAEWALGLRSKGIATLELADVVLEHIGGHSVSNKSGQRLKARLLVRNRIATFRRALAPSTKAVIGLPFFAAIALNLVRKAVRGTALSYMRGVYEGVLLPVPSFDGPKINWAAWKRYTTNNSVRR